MMNNRYSRQEVLEEIGPHGQEKLLRAGVLIVGCGALGCAQAQLLARAGVGRITVVDRDLVEANNLQRQILFDETDASAGMPKAEAAARKLAGINSSIEITGLVKDVTPNNVEELLTGVVLVLDGTDNLETRYLINDACVKNKIPWIYGGVIGTSGMSMSVLPGQGPCFRCLFPQPPPHGSMPTCDTVGVLNTAPAVVASVQATEAIKILVGEDLDEHLIVSVDLWRGHYQTLAASRDEACPCCGQGRYDFLSSRTTTWTTALCGRNAVQIAPPAEMSLSLEDLYRRLARVGRVTNNGLLLQFEVDGCQLVIFPDGRTLVRGTTDESLARTLYDKYLGS